MTYTVAPSFAGKHILYASSKFYKPGANFKLNQEQLPRQKTLNSIDYIVPLREMLQRDGLTKVSHMRKAGLNTFCYTGFYEYERDNEKQSFLIVDVPDSTDDKIVNYAASYSLDHCSVISSRRWAELIERANQQFSIPMERLQTAVGSIT